MSRHEPLPDDVRARGIRTLVELLAYRAESQADDVVFRFINGEGKEDGTLTFGVLHDRARAVASRLVEHVVPGDRVLVLVPPGLDYIASYFGCLYAGAVAVPAYPPNPRRADPRVAAMAADCDARVALAPAAFMSRLDSWLDLTPTLKSLAWLDIGAMLDDDPDAWRPSGVDADSLAMLQYTSGSTGDPRGVMLSHGNLLHNLSLIHGVGRHGPGDNGVHWLPPFHDMGLIGGILQPIYVGLSSAVMAPATFLQRPFLWLQAISRYRATTSGGPNFAYDLCVDRISAEERATLDLSSWRTCFNGAEPVRADTIARFISTFAECGLRGDVMVPCYGLAEATVFVSGGPPNQALRAVPADRRALENGELRTPIDVSKGVTLVASGTPSPEQALAIVDPDTASPCEPGQIGEIWVSGPSVARGYWGRPTATAATFHAHLTGSPRSYLRTGDLGVLVDEQLVVTGRLKDLVILDGRNYYPHDLEVAATRSHRSLRDGFAAAFSVERDDRERLVLVLEVVRQHKPDDDAGLFRAVRTELASSAGVLPHEIVLIRQNAIPRTSSGKIQRRACRSAYLEGAFEIVGEWRAPGSDTVAPREAITAYVLDWVKEELQVDPALLEPRTALRDLGLDSLAAARLVVALEERFGRRIDPSQFWEQPDVGAFAEYLASLGTGAAR
nr:AMP-binding protein [Gemmatimonadaceae bacterium]